MKRKRFTEEQIIGVLKEAEASKNNQEICRKHGITEQTFCRWRSKCGGYADLGCQKAQGTGDREPEAELLPEAHLDNAALKEVLSKTGKARATTESRSTLD